MLAVESIEKAVNHYTIDGKPRKVNAVFFPKVESASVGVRSDGTEFKDIIFSERENFHNYNELKYSDTIAAVTGRWLEKDTG